MDLHARERDAVPSTLLWGLEPLFTSCISVAAAFVLAMEPACDIPGAMLWRGRPVAQVEVMGIVVDVFRKEEFVRFLVDDGTACLPCILWRHSYSAVEQVLRRESEAKVKVGFLIRIQGAPSIYRNENQLTVASLQLEDDPNSELLHWLDSIRLAARPPAPHPPPL